MIICCVFLRQLCAKSAHILSILCLLCFGLVSSTPNAVANPFFVGRFSGLLGGPLDQSAFSLYWNPANLYTERANIDLYVGMISRQATYDRSLATDTPDDVAAVNGGLSSTSALGFIPSFAFHSGLKINDDWKLGFGAGIYIARAGTADWDRDPDASSQYPGAYDGPQRWGALSTFMLLVNYAVGASIEYGALSFGAAVSSVDTTLSTTKAANADKSDELTTPDGELKEGRIFLDDATGSAVNTTLGTTLDLDQIEIGYAWRLPVTYLLQGRAYILYSNAPETSATAQAELQVAQSHLVSIAYTYDEMRFRLEYERQLWSIMDNQEILNIDNQQQLLLLERNFQDTNAYRLRLDYTFSNAVMLNTGLSYEEGVTPEEYHEPGLAEHDQVEVGVGVSFPVTKALSLNSTFFYQYFFDRRVSTSLQSPTTNGDYTDHRQYITFNLKWSL
jgi:long-subunit fatty acid transport protein